MYGKGMPPRMLVAPDTRTRPSGPVLKTRALLLTFALPLATGHAAEASHPAAAAVALQSPEPSEQGVHTYAYRCGDLKVVGTFTADQVTLTLGTRTLTLPQVLSGSGVRYADNAGNEFWGKGLRDATLTLSGSPLRQCHGDGKE